MRQLTDGAIFFHLPIEVNLHSSQRLTLQCVAQASQIPTPAPLASPRSSTFSLRPSTFFLLPSLSSPLPLLSSPLPSVAFLLPPPSSLKPTEAVVPLQASS